MMAPRVKLLLILGLVVLMIFASFIAGCNPSENSQDTLEKADTQQSGPTQEELNEKLKQEAIKANFVEINGGSVDVYTKIYAEGIISVVMKPGLLGEFSLTTEEGNGFGIYTIRNFDLNGPIENSDIDRRITVWGVFWGKDPETGIPIITSTITELND